MNKVSLPEGILMILVSLFSDGIEVLVSLTGFGIIIGEALTFVVGLVLGFWIFMKGGISPLTGIGIGEGIDILTGSFVPGKTGGTIASIIKINASAPDEDIEQIEEELVKTAE